MLVSLIGYIAPLLINFITTPILLNLLGKDAFGLQNIVSVVIGYLMMMDMGLDIPITKFLAEDHARQDVASENRMLSTTLQLYFAIGLSGMVVIILSADFLARRVFTIPSEMLTSAKHVFQLAGIGFLGSVGMSWVRAVSTGLQRFEITCGVSIGSSILSVSLGLASVYFGYGVVGYVLSRVLITLATIPIYWMFVRRLLPEFNIKIGIDKATLRRVRGYVGYGVINRVTGAILSRLDQTLIAIWLGVGATGLYSLPFMIVSSCQAMISNMFSFMVPMASELNSLGDEARLRDYFVRGTRLITALSSIVFVPLFVLGDIFLNLWVGSDIGGQISTVCLLLVLSAYIATMTNNLSNSFVIGTGRIELFTIYTIARGLLFGLACAILIRRFGLLGAGMAMVASNIADIVYLLIVLQRYLHIPPSNMFQRAYFKPLMLGVTLGAFLILLRPVANSWAGLIIVVTIFEISFIAVGYLIQIFGETEKRAIIGLWQVVTGLLQLT